MNTGKEEPVWLCSAVGGRPALGGPSAKGGAGLRAPDSKVWLSSSGSEEPWAGTAGQNTNLAVVSASVEGLRGSREPRQ